MEVKDVDLFQSKSESVNDINSPDQIVDVSHGSEALKDIAFGSIAGVVGKFIEYPFDTVKVRLQSQPDHLPLRYRGPLDCFRQSISQDGFLSLYRGVSAPLVGAALETSSLFFSYRIAQNVLRATVFTTNEPLTLPTLALCGAISGAFTSLILTPIELVKCKMQIPLSPSSATNPSALIRPGALTIMASVYRADGIAGFWRGQLGTLLRETGGSAAWFGSFEGVSAAFRTLQASKLAGEVDRNDKIILPLWQQMLAGACAGMSYNLAFYPADTIKSRMQTEEVGGAGGRQTFWTVGRAIWRQHGLAGLYRGCGITVGRAAPSSALIFTIYESLRNAFE